MRFNYNEIIETASNINKRFGRMSYRENGGASRANYIWDKKVLNFGSGDLQKGDNLFFSKMASDLSSVDNNPAVEADFKSLEEIKVDNHYDVIIAEHVLEHIPINEVDNIAFEFKRLVNENGRLIITLPNIRNFGAWFCDHQHVNYAPPEQIAAIFELHGFKTIDRFGWSKQSHFERHVKHIPEIQHFISFLRMEYGLEIWRYVTYILESKN